MSKVDQQRAMREARWLSRRAVPVPRAVPARKQPTTRRVPIPTPTPAPASTSTLAPDGAPRPERPPLQPGRAIGAYKQPDLVALVAWIMSDNVPRTDSQVLELVMAELGFARQGRTIRSRVSEAITTVLGTSAAAS